MRKLIIKMNQKDYHDFLNMANEYGLTVEEKIYEMINYYLLIERKKFKTCRFYPDST
jgi:hypothetical protein